MKLPRTGQSPNAGVHRIAVDTSAKPVRIWLPSLYPAPARLLCIEDDRRQVRGQGRPARPRTCGRKGPRDLTVDRVRGEVYVKANGSTHLSPRRQDRQDQGRDRPQPPGTGTVLALSSFAGPDGNLYTFTWSKGLWRLDHEGKPMNWDGLDTHSHSHRRHDVLPAPPPGPATLRSARRALHRSPPSDYLTKNPKDAGQVPDAERHRPGRQDEAHRHLAVPERGHSAARRQGQHLPGRPGQAAGPLLSGVLRRQAAAAAQGVPAAATCSGTATCTAASSSSRRTGGIIWHQKDLPKSCRRRAAGRTAGQAQDPVQAALQLLAAPDRRDPGRPLDALRLCALLRPHVRQHQPLHVRGLRLRRGPVRPGLLPQPRPVPHRGDRHQQQPDHDVRQVRQRGHRRPGARVKKPDIPLAWPIYVAVSDR